MSVVASILLYLGVFATSATLVQFGYRRKSKSIQAIGLSFPIILAGLRYDVGLDYMSYFNAYADIVNPQATNRYEGTPGLEYTFQLIAHLSHLLFSSPVLLFFTYAAITVLAFYAALRMMRPKNVGYALFFFFTIFFLNSFNIMRQGAAISIGALALTHYINDNKRRAVLYIIIAALFHISALLLVLYVLIERILEKKFIIRRKIKRFTRLFARYLLLSIAVITAGLSIASVGTFIYESTGRIGTWGNQVSAGVIFKYLLTVACLYLAMYAWKNFRGEDKRLTLFTMIGMVVYSLGIVHNEAARLGMYLIVLTPILLAVLHDRLGVPHLKGMVFVSLGVPMLCVLYLVSVHLSEGEGVRYQYQSIMSGDYTQTLKKVSI